MSSVETMGKLVTYRNQGGVAIFELSDPPANTYTYEMMQELDAAILRARFDPEVHVIVMRGAGDRLRSRAALRPRAPQREWRRDRARPSDRLQRDAHRGHSVG